MDLDIRIEISKRLIGLIKRYGLLFALLPQSLVAAQIIRDGAAGPDASVQIPLDEQNTYSISEDFGERLGPENNTLLHSFSDFSILTGEAARFSGAADIQNVISRVTGNSMSTIDGLLRSDIAGARFFLLNPNGVLFGPNAQLFVGGDFTASTTDQFMFESALDMQVMDSNTPPLLASAVPNAFGFLAQDAGSIVVDGATISNPFGKLHLQGNHINLQNEAIIQNGDRISLDANTISLDAVSRIQLFTRSDEIVEGGIELTATDTITLTGDDSTSSITAIGQGEFAGGAIKLQANEIFLNNGARITSFNNTDAAVHDVELIADQGIYLSGVDDGTGKGSTILTATRNTQQAGSITLDAPIIDLADGADILSQNGFGGTGDVGDITLRAVNSLTLSGSDNEGDSIGQANVQTITTAAGNSGAINVTVGSLTLADGAKIQSSSSSSGDSNSINIVATDSVVMSGLNEQTEFGSTINTTALGFDQNGTAGNIVITTPSLFMRDGARIDSGTVGDGNSGDIVINTADTLVLDGRQSNEPPEDAVEGNSRGSRIASQAFDGSTGNAGSISITAGNVFLRNNAIILSNAYEGQGGDINVAATRILNDNSDVISSVRTADGNGGDVVIDAELLALGNSDIRAQAVAGNGGTINIENVQQYVAFGNSVLDASSESGLDGTIVTPPELRLNLKGDALTTKYLDVSSLLRSSCANYTEVSDGLVLKNTGAKPSPEGLLPSLSSTPDTLHTQLQASADVPQTNVDWQDLLTRGRVQHQQGNYRQSTQTLSAALAMANQSDQPSTIATTLGELGNSLLAAGKTGSAEAPLLQAIALAEQSSDHALLARIYNNLGNVYVVQNQQEKALNAYQKSAEIISHLPHATSHLETARSLANIARLHIHQGDNNLALQSLIQVDNKLPDAIDPSDEYTNLLIHLAKSYEMIARSDVQQKTHGLLKAYAHLKQAESAALANTNMRLLSYVQGNLAALYELDGRLEDALVLTRHALSSAELAQANESIYRWHWLQGKVLMQLDKTGPAIRAYQRAVDIINRSRQSSRERYDSTDHYFNQMVAPVYLELVDALLNAESQTQDPKESQTLLVSARDTIEAFKTSELENYFLDECVLRHAAQQKQLDEVSANTAIVYPIVLPTRIELLVSTQEKGDERPNSTSRIIKRFQVPVDAHELSRHVVNFRQHVDTFSVDRELILESQWLYQHLVQPYYKTVKNAHVDTLVFVPTGVLRLVPMAALHNGKRYLIRDFALATTTGMSLTDPKPLAQAKNRILLSGISKTIGDFPALDAVPGELEAVRSLYGGDVLLNEDFTVDRFTRSVQQNDYSIIHIASHAQFTGDPKGNFLQAFDKPIFLDDLGQVLSTTKYRVQPLELLVLSACQTASSDERAALGLAGVGIKAGARSALASLWSIDDESAAELIENFYVNIKQGQWTKAQALQRAQWQMLDQKAYSHPFHWSAFIMIDNWL